MVISNLPFFFSQLLHVSFSLSYLLIIYLKIRLAFGSTTAVGSRRLARDSYSFLCFPSLVFIYFDYNTVCSSRSFWSKIYVKLSRSFATVKLRRTGRKFHPATSLFLRGKKYNKLCIQGVLNHLRCDQLCRYICICTPQRPSSRHSLA